jgi:cellulose synthase/poly-beta-1,6-N-acetylglucosamine synthase-like glycosyltransferase
MLLVMARSGGADRAGTGSRALLALFWVQAFPVAIANAYLASLTVVAWLARSRIEREAAPDGQPPTSRFGVVVPAHDEQATIGVTVDSVCRQDYRRELFSVHVVADNCRDATASVARAHGADVHERDDKGAPGKGPALTWLIGRLRARGLAADALVFIDADTSMDPGFLRAADTAIRRGGSAWQGYYAVREPRMSTAATLRHAALMLRHYTRPLGRRALGGSSGLFGNGMVFRTDLLRDRQFTTHLTEDMEFQLELLLEGTIVRFLPTAKVEAEMPNSLDAARSQNERWELGRIQLVQRYVPQMLRGLASSDRSRTALVDATLDQLIPPLSVLAAATGGLLGIGVAAHQRRSGPATRGLLTLAAASAAAFALHVLGGLKVARAPRSVFVALLQAPPTVLWKVVLWIRVLVRPERVSWTRTARNDRA